MKQTTSKKNRILAIALTARGFGYSVMEDQKFLENGNKSATGNKNDHSLFKIEKLMQLFQPHFLVLLDVKAKNSKRAPRIKDLHERVIELVKGRNCKVRLLSGNKLRAALLGNTEGTKHEMAEVLAQTFPVELAGKLPPKRRAWENEDGRMDMFDAVGLATVFRRK